MVNTISILLSAYATLFLSSPPSNPALTLTRQHSGKQTWLLPVSLNYCGKIRMYLMWDFPSFWLSEQWACSFPLCGTAFCISCMGLPSEPEGWWDGQSVTLGRSSRSGTAQVLICWIHASSFLKLFLVSLDFLSHYFQYQVALWQGSCILFFIFIYFLKHFLVRESFHYL